MTKWEKFAKDKGIKKRKRSKMVFDEQTDEWKRRHGYDRAGDANKIIIMDGKWSEEGGHGGKGSEDPFTKEEREKKERVEKNAGRQQKNLQQAVATHGKGILPPTLQMSAAPRWGACTLRAVVTRSLEAPGFIQRLRLTRDILVPKFGFSIST